MRRIQKSKNHYFQNEYKYALFVLTVELALAIAEKGPMLFALGH